MAGQRLGLFSNSLSSLLQDTRPWRLPLPGVHYWCVDQPSVMQLKVKLLEQAGAQLHIHDVVSAVSAVGYICLSD